MKGDRSGFRAIRGPIILITVGVLFALQSFNIFGFDQTWPVLLIVIGVLHLFGRMTAPPVPPPGPVQMPPNYNWQPPATDYRTSYAQGPYAQAGPQAGDVGPSKGGFGTSAPSRENPPSGSNPGGAV
ncbi:MAG TPA: DUF5668 domain-containing protein [Bryobacteraceae bacterium]|nr:DUF5668 domain-containing protein [Bryobacteraceae bacterium]